MTPKQKAMAELLQVSLFKLADQLHDTLDVLSHRHPNLAEKLKPIHLEVEAMLDGAIQEFQAKGEIPMATIEDIHSKIIEARKLADG